MVWGDSVVWSVRAVQNPKYPQTKKELLNSKYCEVMALDHSESNLDTVMEDTDK